MPLSAGTRVGSCEIVAPLGAGGMGAVYRAFDTTLRRTVAIKVLTASDDEAGARLLQEARAASALNHPHVCTVYEVGSQDGQSFIVMELVEGRPLSEIIAAQRLSGESVLRYGVQIADALAHAHEHGVIHRDLKSQNVVVTPEGRAKVLDFGVAGRLPELDARTVTKTWEADALSQPGMLVGTLAYMAPEVLRGEPATVRSDIWALGVLLHEMASGKLPFDGRSSVDLIAAIVGPSAAPLPPSVSAGFRATAQRCLAKDAGQRYGSAAEARAALEAVQFEIAAPAPSPGAMPPSAWSRAILAAAAIAALVAIAIAAWSLRRDSSGGVERQTTRTVIPLAADTRLDLGNHSPAVVISPDGRRIAYIGRTGHDSQVYLRSLEQLEATAVDGARGSRVTMPFFSADGEWLGYNVEGRLTKSAIRGGTPVPIAEGEFNRGASWVLDGDLVVTSRESLVRISAAGGEPKTLIALNRERRERSHRLAEVLPGGKAVLFVIGTTMIESFDDATIAVLSLETGEYRVVLAGGTNPHYSRSGHLVYARAGSIMAAPFDLAALQVTGPPVVVVRGVATSSPSGHAEFSLSQNGSLIYAPGRAWGADRRLLWVDRSGRSEPILDDLGAWEEPRISPDGRRLTLDADTAVSHVWVADLARGSLARLTTDGYNNGQPLWAPDSAHVAFLRHPPDGGRSDAVLQAADASEPARRLTTSGPGEFGPGGWLPRSFSRDGTLLALETRAARTGWDTYLLSMGSDRAPEPFLQTEANEFHASLSPDGRWMAYQSDVSGRPEIYVSPLRGAFRRWQASTDGGSQPVWNADGKELVYRNQDQIMSVEVLPGPITMAFGKPALLFKRSFPNPGGLVRDFDLSPDGQRFAVIDYSTAMLPPNELILVQHWDEELKRLVPNGK